MEITLFTECVFEFIGTMILLLMGDGVCAACTLEKSESEGGRMDCHFACVGFRRDVWSVRGRSIFRCSS